MLFIVSILLMLASVVLLVALMRLTRISDFLLAWAISAYASLVLIFQIANLLQQINNAGLVLAFQGGLLLASAALWLGLGRPVILPKISFRFNSLPSILKERRNAPLLLLAGALAGTLGLYILLIYVVPPNNNDALSLHLARVLMWKQLGSYFPWDTARIWQLTFPVNAQLVYLWTILFTNGDHFIAYVPFLSGLVTALVVYRLAIEMEFERRSAILAGLVWLALPVIQLHLTSVRQDLISTWLFLSAFYTLYLWGKTGKKTYMWLSALALGLVVGTNFSIAAYLPGLAVVGVLLLVWRVIPPRRFLAWGAAALLVFLLFSSPIFISNTIHFHSPMGPDAAEMTGQTAVSEVGLVRYLGINITRWSYQFLDFSGLPKPVVSLGVQMKTWLAEGISRLLSINLQGDLATMDKHVFQWKTIYPLQEDAAWFGILGAALCFPTAVWGWLRGFKRRNILMIAPLIFLVTSLVTCTLIRPGWTPYDGRYFIPVSALSASLLPLWFEKKKLRSAALGIVLLLSFSSILMVVLFNPAKQIVGGAAVWKMNRIDMLTRQSYGSKEMLYLADAVLPEKSIVGIASQTDDYQEYGVFGEHFTRTVVPVNPPTEIANPQWLQARGIQYLLIRVAPGYPGDIASGFHYVDSLGNWVIYSNQPPK
jgi:hypothetical protein